MTGRRKLDTALALTPEKREFIRSGGDTREAGEPHEDFAVTPSRVRETLVPLTTRIRVQTAEALRRAYLEHKLSGRLPDTQQEIVEASLRKWLGEHGFLG
jgi:hypothetical protein